ncbi:hypothetical protein CERZMDRAFT_101840 [Cercospora zeae-maydis SCOH1-5]|uniref:Uncharacterized protein n=1 Tax=Cercospora zeae-maydis SCOH1-5 TaxID=717836 RepID=A0A6A6F4B4_9PEZI|nr:hypothetical protein CERZMDRAFT_101840 [Cercospora zeae-maydis SCOH1-5]
MSASAPISIPPSPYKRIAPPPKPKKSQFDKYMAQRNKEMGRDQGANLAGEEEAQAEAAQQAADEDPLEDGSTEFQEQQQKAGADLAGMSVDVMLHTARARVAMEALVTELRSLNQKPDITKEDTLAFLGRIEAARNAVETARQNLDARAEDRICEDTLDEIEMQLDLVCHTRDFAIKWYQFCSH